jgi:hypothetical protein
MSSGEFSGPTSVEVLLFGVCWCLIWEGAGPLFYMTTFVCLFPRRLRRGVWGGGHSDGVGYVNRSELQEVAATSCEIK